VIVGDLNGMDSYGQAGGIYAYSVGTTSCNIGSLWLNWFADTNQHPVIGQSFYRIKNGRFEQIGVSWLKHGFYALSGNLCFNNCQPTDGTHLGVHCSDPYDAGLNGSQGNGPRSEVNASTGYFPFPYLLNPPTPLVIDRRIQCASADVNPTLNAGAIYYAEGQYVTPDDAAAGNKNNNASCRRIVFTNAPANYPATFSGGTIQQSPAILMWQVHDASVVTNTVDIPNDGRFIVAKKVTSIGGGSFHYEFAVHNLNSDRSGRGFTVNFPVGTTISNPGFHFVPSHSGEVWSNTPWTNTINGNTVNWVTQTAQQNLNANAIRFGQTYNFWFDATAGADTGSAIELFKPEPCPADPVVTPSTGYLLNTAAPFDNPAIVGANGPSGDDNQATVPIGFTFNYYGTNYTTLSICTNGFLQFNGSSVEWSNSCLPSVGTPNAVIAGYWDDLIAPVGAIKYQTIGVAPNRRFVVHYNNVQLYANNGSLQSFKIILDETTNKITSSIISSMDGGASATRGIEDQGGNTGTQASCAVGGSAIANTSQTYTPFNGLILPSAYLTVTGSTGPGGSLTWTVNSVAKAAPVVLVASLDPGPLNLGALGTLNLGLTPGLFAVIADGAGALQPANPVDFTDWYCGDYAVTVPLPAGLPAGLVIYSQGVIMAPASVPAPPNGQFHITTPITTNT
jgi:hypothetical protein